MIFSDDRRAVEDHVQRGELLAGLVARGLCHELVETKVPLHDATLSQRLWDELVKDLRAKFSLEVDSSSSLS